MTEFAQPTTQTSPSSFPHPFRGHGLISRWIGRLVATACHQGYSLVTHVTSPLFALMRRTPHPLDLFEANQPKPVRTEELLKRQADVQCVAEQTDPISLNELHTAGLLPTHKMEIDHATIYWSNIFLLDRHYSAVLCLVEIDDQLTPRVMYSSRSQGTWRVLPYENYIQWGKGHCETDIQPPAVLICALNKQVQRQKPLTTDFSIHSLIPSGVQGCQPYLDRVKVEPFMRLQEGAAAYFFKKCVQIHKPPVPSTILMPEDEGNHPDFSRCVERKHPIPEYGDITARVYASFNRQLLYMFYEAHDKKAWLAHVEWIQDAPITTYGVRSKAPDLMGMHAPRLEYYKEIPKELEQDRIDHHLYNSIKYRCNCKYVDQLAIIQAYEAARRSG